MIGNLTIFAALYAVSWNNRRLAAGLILGLPSIVTTWSFFFQQNPALGIAQIVSVLVFFTYTFVTILQRVFRAEQVGLDELFGALNGYLLIGVSWGLVYSLVHAFSPGAFALGGMADYTSTFIYFSFSTLGTLGMGDVHPILPLARSLCILEMLVGLFFVTVLFGKLVAVFRLETLIHSRATVEKPPFERSLRVISRLPAWSFVLLVAAANLGTSVANDKMQMPLFLDTWATSAGVMVGGLWLGLLGGMLYNLLMAGLFWGYSSWVWGFNTALVALLTRYFWKRGLIDINRPFALIACGLATAFANTFLGILVVNISGLPRNQSTLEIHNLIFSKTGNQLAADFGQQFLMESIDKIVSLAIAMIVAFAISELRSKSQSENRA